jgi:hypothetical protein
MHNNTSTIDSHAFHALLQATPSFDGSNSAVATRWIGHIERIAVPLMCNDGAKLAVAFSRLEGHAYDFMEGLELSSWMTFKETFLSRYAEDVHIIRQRLNKCKQGATEDVLAFIDRFRVLAMQCKYSTEVDLLNRFLQGLLPGLYDRVMITCPSTYEEAVERAVYFSRKLTMNGKANLIQRDAGTLRQTTYPPMDYNDCLPLHDSTDDITAPQEHTMHHQNTVAMRRSILGENELRAESWDQSNSQHSGRLHLLMARSAFHLTPWAYNQAEQTPIKPPPPRPVLSVHHDDHDQEVAPRTEGPTCIGSIPQTRLTEAHTLKRKTHTAQTGAHDENPPSYQCMPRVYPLISLNSNDAMEMLMQGFPNDASNLPTVDRETISAASTFLKTTMAGIHEEAYRTTKLTEQRNTRNTDACRLLSPTLPSIPPSWAPQVTIQLPEKETMCASTGNVDMISPSILHGGEPRSRATDSQYKGHGEVT